jgi:hypothetical protein
MKYPPLPPPGAASGEAAHASVVISSETYYTIGLSGLWLSDSNFFLLSNYWNIEYRIGELKKLSDYRISDQGLNLSDYRISDSEKLSVVHLCKLLDI